MAETPGMFPPGAPRKLKNMLIYLAVENDEKGENETEVFRIKRFKNSALECEVELYSIEQQTMYKATFNDPKKIIPAHDFNMEVVTSILQQILLGKFDDVVACFKTKDTEDDLTIRYAQKQQITALISVNLVFVYGFRAAKMSITEQLQNVVYEDMDKLKIELQPLTPSRGNVPCRFDTNHNNAVDFSNNERTIVNQGTAWAVVPVDFEMQDGIGFRARFRFENWSMHQCCFGIVNNSFANYNVALQNGQHNWMATFVPANYILYLAGSTQHNGSIRMGKGLAMFKGSLVTIEWYPSEGLIQYFVDGCGAALHTGCGFGNVKFRFAVALSHPTHKVTLLSLDRL